MTYQEDTLPEVCCKYLRCVNGILTFFIRSIMTARGVLLHPVAAAHITRNYENFDFNSNKFDGSFFSLF